MQRYSKMDNQIKLYKIEQVLELIPVSVSTWYRLIKKNKELSGKKIGRGTFWSNHQIQKFIEGL